MRRRGEFSSETKESARKRANYSCEICGREGSTQIHHMIFLSSEAGRQFPIVALSSLENAMCLCANCHTDLHKACKEPPYEHVERVRKKVGTQLRMAI